MDTAILQFIIIVSFIVGWVLSLEKLKQSAATIKHKDLWSYFIGK